MHLQICLAITAATLVGSVAGHAPRMPMVAPYLRAGHSVFGLARLGAEPDCNVTCNGEKVGLQGGVYECIGLFKTVCAFEEEKVGTMDACEGAFAAAEIKDATVASCEGVFQAVTAALVSAGGHKVLGATGYGCLGDFAWIYNPSNENGTKEYFTCSDHSGSFSAAKGVEADADADDALLAEHAKRAAHGFMAQIMPGPPLDSPESHRPPPHAPPRPLGPKRAAAPAFALDGADPLTDWAYDTSSSCAAPHVSRNLLATAPHEELPLPVHEDDDDNAEDDEDDEDDDDDEDKEDVEDDDNDEEDKIDAKPHVHVLVACNKHKKPPIFYCKGDFVVTVKGVSELGDCFGILDVCQGLFVPWASAFCWGLHAFAMEVKGIKLLELSSVKHFSKPLHKDGWEGISTFAKGKNSWHIGGPGFGV